MRRTIPPYCEECECDMDDDEDEDGEEVWYCPSCGRAYPKDSYNDY